MQVDLMTAFFNQLKILALKDENIFFITADHGAWALSDCHADGAGSKLICFDAWDCIL